MKQRLRKTRITIRKQEVLIVRGAEQLADNACPLCGTPFPANALAALHAQGDVAQAGLNGDRDDAERNLLPAACARHTED